MEYRSAGESHGLGLMLIVSDVPAGIPLCQDDFDRELARRQGGYGRGARQSIESDHAQLYAGIRGAKSTGSPIGILIQNKDHASWERLMDPWTPAAEASTCPRPNHADLAGCLKIGSDDCRDVLERASARESAARVCAGAVGKALLRQLGVGISSRVLSIAGIDGDDKDPAVRQRLDQLAAAGDSAGGIIELRVEGLIPGLGSYSQRQKALDARLAAAMLSIPAIKGVEFGDGFLLGSMSGSQAADRIQSVSMRSSNHMGGIEGGMSNGQELVLRMVMKPIPSISQTLESIDLRSAEPAFAFKERGDVCAVPAAAVVAEAECALVLADAYCEKFGADCLDDMIASLRGYKARISWPEEA